MPSPRLRWIFSKSTPRRPRAIVGEAARRFDAIAGFFRLNRHDRRAWVDSLGVKKRIRVQQVATGSQVLRFEPEQLTELVASAFGVESDDSMIRELCWAVQAHLAGRARAGRWDLIEVEPLLDDWAHSYRVEDLQVLLGCWVRVVGWLHCVELLSRVCTVEYAVATRRWLERRIALAAHCQRLIDTELMHLKARL